MSLVEFFSKINKCPGTFIPDSRWLQKEAEVKVLPLKNDKYCNSLSSKLNEKEEILSKLNVRNFNKQMEWKNN